MKEILELSFGYQNLIPTILLLFVFIYWITVILGAIDISSIDIDIDVDVEPDIDVDVDAPSLSWLNNILVFFNLGKIPFMVWLSFVAMPLWMLSVIANATINNESFLLSTLIFIPILIVCMFIAKFATIPFIPIFRALDKGSENLVFPGKVCTVLITPTNGKIGQAEIKTTDSFILVYIYTDNDIILKKGDTALIIEKHNTKDYYLVEPYENEA